MSLSLKYRMNTPLWFIPGLESMEREKTEKQAEYKRLWTFRNEQQVDF